MNVVSGSDSRSPYIGTQMEDKKLNVRTDKDEMPEDIQSDHKADQISRDGDTLELNKSKISDVMLKGMSDSRLKTMLQNQEITRQQYDKVMNDRKETEGVVLKL